MRKAVIAMAALAMAAASPVLPATGYAQAKEKDNPVYSITLKDRDFESVSMEVEGYIQDANMRIIKIMDLQNGFESRGKKFPPYRVYLFCNLAKGFEVLDKFKGFGAFIPCKIFVYQEGNNIIVGSYRPTEALKHLPHDEKAAAAVKAMEEEIIGILSQLDN